MTAASAVGPSGAPRYWAFLSYSTVTRCGPTGCTGASKVLPFPGGSSARRPPWAAPTRFRPILSRDRDELEVAADLNERLQVALRASALPDRGLLAGGGGLTLVDAEIRHFKALNGDAGCWR